MSKAHPGFKSVASSMARKDNLPIERANAILASRTRAASPAARRANPNLNRVPRSK